MFKIFYISFLLFFISSCASTDEITRRSEPSTLTSIPLELTTFAGVKTQFTEGEEIQFLLSLASNAYIYMYHIDAAQNLIQVLPNEQQKSNYYKSGYFLTIPEYKDGFRFKITQPLGEQVFWVIASDQFIEIDSQDKSITTIRETLKQKSKRAYGEYTLSIITVEKYATKAVDVPRPIAYLKDHEERRN